MTALIIQASVFILYVAYIWSRFGVLYSISESYYHIRHKGLFTLFCFIIGLPMFFHSKAFHPEVATSGDYTFFFFTSMLLAFTGAAADFYRKTTDVVHYLGALICVVSALLGLWLQYDMLQIPVVFVITTVPLLFLKNRVWWIEINAFAWIMVGLLILNLR